MSTQNIAMCQDIPQPQSIVHHLARVGSKMAAPLRKQLGVASRKRTRSHLRNHRCSQNGEEGLIDSKGTAETLTEIDIYESIDDGWSTTSASSQSGDSCHSALYDQEEEKEFFIPLNQNELLIECFMANECSDVTFIILFCAGKCCLSEQLEDIILIRTMQCGSQCQCRKVDSRMAPMLTKKLQIGTDKPTIVAVRNGSVVGRISDFPTSECWEQVEQWLANVKVLSQNDSESDFQCLSTQPC